MLDVRKTSDGQQFGWSLPSHSFVQAAIESDDEEDGFVMVDMPRQHAKKPSCEDTVGIPASVANTAEVQVLADGGMADNLGLFPLLRRRVQVRRFIYDVRC